MKESDKLLIRFFEILSRNKVKQQGFDQILILYRLRLTNLTFMNRFYGLTYHGHPSHGAFLYKVNIPKSFFIFLVHLQLLSKDKLLNLARNWSHKASLVFAIC